MKRKSKIDKFSLFVDGFEHGSSPPKTSHPLVFVLVHKSISHSGYKTYKTIYQSSNKSIHLSFVQSVSQVFNQSIKQPISLFFLFKTEEGS